MRARLWNPYRGMTHVPTHILCSSYFEEPRSEGHLGPTVLCSSYRGSICAPPTFKVCSSGISRKFLAECLDVHHRCPPLQDVQRAQDLYVAPVFWVRVCVCVHVCVCVFFRHSLNPFPS